MPLPKGINDPAVRAAWLAQRHEKLDAFDRLVAKGMSESKAARALGMTLGGVRSMRGSAEALADGRHIGRAGGAQIDLGLALLSIVRKPGECLSSEDIAAWCGCARTSIQDIEQRALRKVRQRLVGCGGGRELAGELQGLLDRLVRTD
jgi:hypothetical protein